MHSRGLHSLQNLLCLQQQKPSASPGGTGNASEEFHTPGNANVPMQEAVVEIEEFPECAIGATTETGQHGTTYHYDPSVQEGIHGTPPDRAACIAINFDTEE